MASEAAADVAAQNEPTRGVRTLLAVVVTAGAVMLVLVGVGVRFIGLLNQALMAMLLLAAVATLIGRGIQAARRRLVWTRGVFHDEARRRRWRGKREQAARWHAVARAAWWLIATTTVFITLPRVGVAGLLALVGVGAGVVLAGQLARPRLPSAGVSAVSALAAVALMVELVRALLPTPPAEVVLSPPFSGEWIVLQGGNVPLVNHHAVDPRQAWALDLMKLEGGEAIADPGSSNADWHSFGQPLYAPASGTVVAAVDGIADVEGWSFETDAAKVAGNHVVLDIGDHYVLMAHIRHGTVAVKEGDRVEVGEPIGEVGNSGNTTAPHLHLQVQTRPRLLDEDNRAVPFSFHEGARALTRNDLVRAGRPRGSTAQNWPSTPSP